MLSIEQVHEQLNIWGFPHHHWELTVGNTHLAFNPKTMIMTWVVMILVALFAVVATRKMSLRRPTGAQNVMELAFEGIWGLVKQNMDARKGQTIITVVVTYFIFILFSNLIGLVPTLTSPTADYNTTLALSLCTFALIYIMGIKYKGLGYFKHYVKPFVFFLQIGRASCRERV